MRLVFWRLDISGAGYMCYEWVDTEFRRKFRVLSGDRDMLSGSKSLRRHGEPLGDEDSWKQIGFMNR